MYLIDYHDINYNNTAMACYPLASPFCTPWLLLFVRPGDTKISNQMPKRSEEMLPLHCYHLGNNGLFSVYKS
tara:strand:- start:1929 stop:2144 length:216 start_codon:yes stop_codon:yes gene_type:complete